MVNSRADAEKLVAVTHYPPRGSRSFGPNRALLYGGADYPKHANETVVAFAMIETRQALDNLDEILSVEGRARLGARDERGRGRPQCPVTIGVLP